MTIGHYENFPVASILCPPALRPPIVAIYHFARTADDIADEGSSTAAQRLADLGAYRDDLAALFAGRPTSARWPQVFGPLREACARHRLPHHLLDDLLDAFMQDAGNPLYADRTQLLDYCRRSANPVGRLLLHLYAVDDRAALERSDAICSALQLINFWQDLSIDLPRGRHYLPLADAARHGLAIDPARPLADGPALRALVRELCDWARELMRRGAPLALSLPGRIGWELRCVVQGGLRILERIAALDHATLRTRPVLGPMDLPRLLWRAARMQNGTGR